MLTTLIFLLLVSIAISPLVVVICIMRSAGLCDADFDKLVSKQNELEMKEHLMRDTLRGSDEPHKLVQGGATPSPATKSAGGASRVEDSVATCPLPSLPGLLDGSQPDGAHGRQQNLPSCTFGCGCRITYYGDGWSGWTFCKLHDIKRGLGI